jgi:hypothetical protein
LVAAARTTALNGPWLRSGSLPQRQHTAAAAAAGLHASAHARARDSPSTPSACSSCVLYRWSCLCAYACACACAWVGVVGGAMLADVDQKSEPFSPSPASTVRVLTLLCWVTTVRRRDGHRLAGNWTRDSTAETRRRGRFSQQQFVHERLLLIQRARLAFSRAAGPVVVGWTLCRFCDTHLSPGASQYMGETGVISKACQPTSTRLPGTKAPCYTFVLAGENGLSLLHREPGRRGGTQYRSRQCEAASCTWSNGAAASETGGRRGRGVTGVQEGGPFCSQGRTISACWGSSSKRKVAMAAL